MMDTTKIPMVGVAGCTTCLGGGAFDDAGTPCPCVWVEVDQAEVARLAARMNAGALKAMQADRDRLGFAIDTALAYLKLGAVDNAVESLRIAREADEV